MAGKNAMSFLKFIEYVNKRMNELDKKATNPFINRNSDYNPLRNYTGRTYVWIEEDEKNKE